MIFAEGVHRGGLQRCLCLNQIAERDSSKLTVKLEQAENPFEPASLNVDVVCARLHRLLVEERVFVAVDYRVVVFTQQDGGGLPADVHASGLEDADLFGDGLEFLQCVPL